MIDTARTTAAIREAANEWLARLAQPDVPGHQREAFVAWLRASPENVREYLLAESTWLAIEHAARADDSDVDALLRLADGNVVALDRPVGASPATVASASRSRDRRWRYAAAAAVLVLGVSAVLAIRFGVDTGETYATGVGEMRTLALADGSTVELNTRSRIRVDFDDDARNIHLDQGEAYFSVAKDPDRPFKVMTGTLQVRAVGTAFNVYRKPDSIVVSVVEGTVAVKRGDPDARARRGTPLASSSLDLSAGQSITLSGASTTGLHPDPASHQEIERALAWRSRRLVFEGTPLSDIVAEFNRYNRKQLDVRDTALANRRISGVFDPNKPQSLLRFLAMDARIATREMPDGTIVIETGNKMSR